MCELSIIVPVYKAEPFIERTLNALLTQKGVEYEIILVDDGSPDNSGAICDKFSDDYNNVKCLHLKNGGPSKARNIGIDNAKGKYIAFCDSDDIPSDNMYGILLNELKKHNAQLALCDIYTERDQRNFGFPWKGCQHFVGTECQNILLASMLGNPTDDDKTQPVWGSSVRSIYRHDFLNKFNIRFPENIRFAEDLVFNVKYIVHCTSCFVLDKAMYRYTLNSESLMNSYNKYNSRMFDERLALISYITKTIKLVDTAGHLSSRFATSQRSYIHECIGNAARAIPTYGYGYAYKEICRISNNETVKELFTNLQVRNIRKRLLYNLIHRRLNMILLLYYAFRLR